MSRVEAIQSSFEKVAGIAFDNLPEDIACYMVVYLRDKSTGENGGDGTINIKTISKNMMYYDAMSVREYIRNDFNPIVNIDE